MKLKQLLAALLAVAALAIPASADDDTPLAKEMSKANKALKIVNRGLADPAAKAANLAKIAEAKAAFEKSVAMEPAMTKDVPAAGKEKFLADYKAAMEASIKTLDELKAAVEAGKADEAAKVMEKLTNQKKDGHKAFQKEEE